MTEHTTTINPDTRAVKPTVITVNDTAVTVPDNRVTGLQIKEAAIAAGVPIATAFVLFEITKKGRKLVRDDDAVKVNKNSVFEAITDDVNS
ncbi:multiubiquitin domain-containing protein [uncultured Microbacterium sp.]|uniref:multiubiquitin domain-containing protein n=1 Tax=uncultured Microbacterium sp. TaxID=191216 RepID=UPI0025F56AD7|nr:multiubiquitin domain-containing protein [uncultured Microbacterium sp.]